MPGECYGMAVAISRASKTTASLWPATAALGVVPEACRETPGRPLFTTTEHQGRSRMEAALAS